MPPTHVETPDAPVEEGGTLGEALTARGHEVVEPAAVMVDQFGGGQAVTREPDGTLAGVLTLPVDLGPGTHVLRLWAGEEGD